MRKSLAPTPVYDPYGQPLSQPRTAARTAIHSAERRLRIPVLLFWAAALALVAGRLVLPVEPLGAPASTAVTRTVATPS